MEDFVKDVVKSVIAELKNENKQLKKENKDLLNYAYYVKRKLDKGEQPKIYRGIPDE